MRLYNLDDRGHKELLKLIDTVKSHTDLTVDEKTANIEAINIKLNGFKLYRPDILATIKESEADTDDIMKGGF